MDGFKKRLKDSIQLRLSFSLSLAILVVAIVAGIFSFAAAFDEAHELQDDVLRQVAALFDRQHLQAPIVGDSGRLNDGDEESRVTVQYLADGPTTRNGVDPEGPLPLPPTLSDGMHTLKVKGEPFRVLIKTLGSGKRLAVAQETGVRNDIARNGALRTVMPFLILLPILLFVAALVRKMFQPISSLAVEIDRRGDQELHPVAQDDLPLEVLPFVIAINRLLNRVARSMDTQRRFVADAAHELRSPLTALSLQAERLADADMSDAARERLNVLRQGIERGRSLLDQLLTLARAQSATSAPHTLVSVQYVYRRALEDLMPLAEAKQIDIGVEGESDVQILVDEMDLSTIVKNLVDNAIRYTPIGGRIDLSVRASHNQAILQIRDSGPGIPPTEQERVFDPFYRVLGSDEIGSGLGLSIVKAIADRIGAQIQLGHTDEKAQSGLCVRLFIPMTPPAQGN
jgi:two-component system, OmpR family, sensor kinase